MSMPTGDMTGIVPERFQKRLEELQHELQQLQDNIASMTETATSEDRLVSVTVGARGELIDLDLDPRIYRTTNAAALSDTIRATIWEATEAVTKRVADMTRPLLPEGMEDIDLEGQLRRVPLDAGDR